MRFASRRLEAQQWREYCAGIRERYYNPAMTEAELAEMHATRWDGD